MPTGAGTQVEMSTWQKAQKVHIQVFDISIVPSILTTVNNKQYSILECDAYIDGLNQCAWRGGQAAACSAS